MTRTEREVAVVGLGAATPLGITVEGFWTSLCEGRTAIRPATGFENARYRAHHAAEIAAIEPDAETDERPPSQTRSIRIASTAAREALENLRGDFSGPAAVIVVGTTLGGNELFTRWLSERGPSPDVKEIPASRVARALSRSKLDSAARALAEETGARGAVQTVSVACASGTAAIGVAAELIRRGEAELALAGGYDALSEFVFSGFDSLRALSETRARPFDRRRDGLTLGEGAGFVVLESRESMERKERRPIAWVRGYGSAADAFHMTRPTPTGAGLARAVEAALSEARVSAAEIGFISSHGTATRFNDAMEAAAYQRVFGQRARTIPINSIKGAIGHTLGAAGALEVIMTALVLASGIVPPTAGHDERDPECELDIVAGCARELSERPRFALSVSSAFAGTNAALVLERV